MSAFLFLARPFLPCVKTTKIDANRALPTLIAPYLCGMGYKMRIEYIALQPMSVEPLYGISEYLRVQEALNAHSGGESFARETYARIREAQKPQLYSSDDLTKIHSAEHGEMVIQNAKNKSVAVVSLVGTMLAEGGICQPSINELSNQIEAAANNINITGVVIRTNSGGGEVTAAQRLSNIIAESKLKKPILMYVDGMAASGAYWAGAFCDEIMMGGETTSVGSIGVVIQMNKEVIEYLKENTVSIFSDGSERKQDVFQAILRGDNQFVKNESLNPIRAVFADVVKKGRANSRNTLDETFLDGRMTQTASMAIKAGLADKKGTLNDAIERVITLSNNRRLEEKRKILIG